MIVIFGSVGSGKSTQGEMLAKRHNWQHISSGQIFRDSNDAEINAIINRGELVPDDTTNRVILEILDRESIDGERGDVILDGYPRRLEQAKFLIQHNEERYNHHNINLALMIDVNKDEVLKRMLLRGRADDTPEKIERRLAIYHAAINPILDYFSKQGILVLHVDGNGSIDEIHENIEAELTKYGII
ncbi:MAG: nucleoside monophosphate kinase [Candidatus Nomurabacteria bacterium]|nr:nucleoside monophosphate kinase [Candidatus Nomurabacteria bacterium]